VIKKSIEKLKFIKIYLTKSIDIVYYTIKAYCKSIIFVN
jgi:hypothetical protein